MPVHSKTRSATGISDPSPRLAPCRPSRAPVHDQDRERSTQNSTSAVSRGGYPIQPMSMWLSQTPRPASWNDRAPARFRPDANTSPAISSVPRPNARVIARSGSPSGRRFMSQGAAMSGPAVSWLSGMASETGNAFARPRHAAAYRKDGLSSPVRNSPTGAPQRCSRRRLQGAHLLPAKRLTPFPNRQLVCLLPGRR